MLDAIGNLSSRNRFIKRVTCSYTAKKTDIMLAKTGNRPLIQAIFSSRNNQDITSFSFRTLRDGIKMADSLNLVTKKIQPKGRAFYTGIYVHDTATNGKFAILTNRLCPDKPIFGQKLGNHALADILPRGKFKAVCLKKTSRGYFLHPAIDGGKKNKRFFCCDMLSTQKRQAFHTTGNNSAVRRNPVIGQTIPCWQNLDLYIFIYCFQSGRDLHHARIITCNKHHPAMITGLFSQKQLLRAIHTAIYGFV